MLQSVLVKGEVSNCKYHSSGHIYFTLKDPRGTISCVMFAGNRSGLSFRLTEGQQVIVGGTVDVYERDGKYQIYVKQVTLDGHGALYERFEQLKRELAESGMFDPAYKSPIPKYCRTVGVVTANTGAAIRDIIQVARRRNPFVRIILYPAIVQGEAAVASIVNGIRALEALGVDVMIVGRGGGSIEDLWAFNERAVAEAVFHCSVPIISAVGHETDTTIIDFVSDLRAPTPSAAAELAVADIGEVFRRIEQSKEKLNRLMAHRLHNERAKATRMELHLKAMSPESRIREKKMSILRAEEVLQERMRAILTSRRHAMQLYIARMKGLSPLEKLSSGYAYVSDGDGIHVRSVNQVQEGSDLTIQLKDGRIHALVQSTEVSAR